MNDQFQMLQHKNFWVQEFLSEPATLNLPIDFARPLQKSDIGASFSFQLGDKDVDALQAIAKQKGLSMFILLFSIYNVLLNKLSNQEEIVVGVPICENQMPGAEQLFDNILPVKICLSQLQYFKDFLSEIKRKTETCFEHQEYAYEELVKALYQDHGIKQNLLFNVIFEYNCQKERKFSGIQHYIDSKPDLVLTINEDQNQLFLSFTYCTALFLPETIVRFAGYFSRIAEAVIADIGVPIPAINILDEQEQDMLLHTFNATRADFDDDKSIIDLFERQVLLTPGNAALRFEDASMSYAELNAAANRLADHLRKAGIGPADIVALLTGRSIDMLVSILGILKAGAAYLPLDPSLPAERIEHMLKDSAAKMLIKDATAALSFDIATLAINDISLETGDAGNLNISIEPSDRAYVIYTSGSTGMPKGVEVCHSCVINLISHQQKTFGITQQDRILQFSTIIFDASVEQIWLALLSGASLVLIGKDTIADNERFNTYIRVQQVTHLHATPSYLELLELDGDNSIKRVVSGGEVCKAALVKKFIGRYSFYNEYGPTETTVTAVEGIVGMDWLSGNSIPIGKPLSNTFIYIVDKDLHLQPVGVTGELCIGGASVARGYVNNAKQTEEKFVPNPFEAGGRMYRTGDLARWLPDGNIEYLGRMDEQVKIRGFRIEPGEIEHHLKNYSGIKESAVLVKGEEGNKYLVAYYVSASLADEHDIANYLRQYLPDYMVPASYVKLDKMPLTASGKLNRRLLPEPVLNASKDYTAPRTNTEKQLAALWAEVLKTGEELIGIHSNFFELGGHSLKAMLLINKIRKSFNVPVALKQLFSEPTISALSKAIESSAQVAHVSIPKAGVKQYYVLSSAQRRMYFLYEYNKASLAYNMPQVIHLSGPLDKDKLLSALRSLVLRHESLRTSFVLVEDEVFQKINDGFDFSIENYGCNSKVEADSIIDDFTRPFNLNTDNSLFRVGLICLNEQEHLLLIDMHHIIMDGVSNTIVLNDLMSLYSGSLLNAPRLQYKDYAEWQHSEGEQLRVSQQKAFWLSAFSEVPAPLNLPADHCRPAGRSDAGASFSFRIGAQQAQGLKAIAEREGVSMFMLLLSICNILLSKLSNQEDIIVGVPFSGRDHADLENMVGMFVNTLTLRNHVNAELKFKSYLQKLRKKTLLCFDHKEYQYEDLVESLNLVRDTSRNSLFDVLFIYQNFEKPELIIPGLTLSPYEMSYNISKFDLSLTIWEDDNDLTVYFEYRTDLFKAETIERFSTYFKRIVSAIIDDVDIKLGQISVVDKVEQKILLSDFNNTHIQYTGQKSIIELFEGQVKENGSLNAVLCGELCLTYEELNIKVNKLSHYLLLNGVKGEDIVGLHIKRSADMVIALLAVLKSGAAYVSLDPDYPMERIEGIIIDSGLLFIITDDIKELGGLKNGINYIDIHKDADKIRVEPGINPGVIIHPDNAAYLIYTSGTTGKSKGVVIEHRSLLDYTLTFKNYYSVSSGDKVIQQASLSFDTAVEEIFPALLSGSSVIVVPSGGKDIEALINAINNNNATILSTIPLVINELNQHPGSISSLRMIISGGETLFPAYVDKLIGSYDIYNTYGPSECTVCATYNKIKVLKETSYIGRPINNRSVYIIDKNRALQPIGVAGELCIAGAGVARGYVNNAKQTEEKFVSNPFEAGGRMYRTGDLARWLPNGNIEYLGRMDEQVKIRGVRIELGEIEHHLNNYSGIKESAVLVKGEGVNKYLVAYYVATGETEEQSLRSYLRNYLPDYMVPASYVKLDKMPLTASGKLNRRLLPEPVLNASKDYVAPRTNTEKQLAALWAEVLKTGEEHIGVHSNFFKLGGHSLKAMLLINKVFKHFGKEISLAYFFSNPTIKRMASLVEMDAWLNHTTDYISAEQTEIII